jgi:hypothetical protein
MNFKEAIREWFDDKRFPIRTEPILNLIHQCFEELTSKRKVWMITTTVNDYNQYGEYIGAIYITKPTFSEIKSLNIFTSRYDLDDCISKLLEEGEVMRGDTTYYLDEVEQGESL